MSAVVVKKEIKVKTVFAAMDNPSDMQEFKVKFKELYPDDWKRINNVYQKEERRDTKGKGHPMPEPEKYLENMFKVARAKISE
ncbi:hypothetical protein Psfp_00386 [Pelotomaculum sp. FP]|uniref:hypothetical protein n=1 Tax=Pelotomaculum sp. FP TaxID=261474 RepID=UPI0010662D48|nr:hypothetical protein [Pelotomaculum sp. FP]TEB17514.1 hypothetical protein Psfp_00386 [Pelotomaculum sp. FP]